MNLVFLMSGGGVGDHGSQVKRFGSQSPGVRNFGSS